MTKEQMQARSTEIAKRLVSSSQTVKDLRSQASAAKQSNDHHEYKRLRGELSGVLTVRESLKSEQVSLSVAIARIAASALASSTE